VLYMLRHNLLDGSKPTATALAERFQIQRSVVTRILAKLETGGHIIRGTDPRDGRAQQITITENGKHLSDFVEQEYFQEMKRALGEIEARDIECMERSLEILTGVAVDLGMGEAARRINELSDR
jgi:DNA-binding MarR family transcriptional regulator